MTNLRMRLASTLAMMMGALGSPGQSFVDRPDPRGPAPKAVTGWQFWPRTQRRSKLDIDRDPYEPTYNMGRNAEKRARRALERSIRADLVAAAGGRYRVPKHRFSLVR